VEENEEKEDGDGPAIEEGEVVDQTHWLVGGTQPIIITIVEQGIGLLGLPGTLAFLTTNQSLHY